MYHRSLHAAATLLAVVLVLLTAGACGSLPVPPVYEAAPGTPLSTERGFFVLYGDARPRLALEVWRDDATEGRLAVIARIAELRPDFAVNSGDFVAQGADPADWAQFDREAAAIRANDIPLYAGLGNHDLAGDEGRALRNARSRFPSLRGRRAYTLDYGATRLVVLDTNLRSMPGNERDDEAAWLRTTLDAAEQDAAVREVLLVTHHPPFTNATAHEPSQWVRNVVLAIAHEHPKVSAIVSGHVHSYERFRSAPVTGHAIDCIVSGGGGAPLVPLRDEDRAYQDLYDGPGGDRPRGHHILVVRPGNPTTVEVQMLTKPGQWEVVDRVTLTR